MTSRQKKGVKGEEKGDKARFWLEANTSGSPRTATLFSIPPPSSSHTPHKNQPEPQPCCPWALDTVSNIPASLQPNMAHRSNPDPCSFATLAGGPHAHTSLLHQLCHIKATHTEVRSCTRCTPRRPARCRRVSRNRSSLSKHLPSMAGRRTS